MDYITVENFVKQVLATIPQPYGQDLIERFFHAVETRPEWLEAYHELVTAHGAVAVNNSIGYNIVGQTSLHDLDWRHKSIGAPIDAYTNMPPGAPPIDDYPHSNSRP
jgi:hypothetical protein